MAVEENYDFIVSVIVPALNEEGNIDEFCHLFAAMLEKALFKGELIFVDDGSTDRTLDRIEENARKYNFIKFATHQRRRGLTDALHTGFSIARGKVYVFYPADLQYLPENIPDLVRPIARGADICTGWKQGKYNKRFVSSIYNWFSRKIFNLKVHDLNSVKAFRREVVENIFLRQDWHRYLVVLAANEGFKVEEEKVPLYPRKWGRTKFSIWRIPVGVLDMLAVKFQITFLRKPLLFFGGCGVVVFILGILVGLYAIYLRYFLEQGNRTLLYLVILLMGMGMGLFIMGFMSEGLTALKEEIGDLRRKNKAILDKLDGRKID
ncbi:MAG: glycosyltransferase family 2 protein [candidate division Zixibacteria bacterium]|nr:glycosyltransferase family 2 protein [candidate division Zixibacteria bacterium]MDD5426663.1 glycosyltransferase family 2 protein [candidate division Zixibacteria bacterium]